MTEAALAGALAALADEMPRMQADLARMVACNTAFPPGSGYPEFAGLMRELLQPLGFSTREARVPEALWQAPGASGERVNVIAARPAADPALPVVSLYFHVDTVPPGEGWTRPPLALTVEGERLYGRGTADMKGSIAAVLGALRVLARFGLPLAFEPVLLLCTDEEGGLYPGIRWLAEQGAVRGHLLSFNGGAVPRIWAGCFGSFDLRVTVHGRAAHSGDPAGGVNAIEAALPLLDGLMELKRRVESRCSALPPPPHYGGRKLAALLTIAAAHGGEKGSALPARFDILLNRRYAPEEEFEDALAEIEAVIQGNQAATLGVETALLGHLAPVSDPTGPHWPRWQAALARGFGWSAGDFRAWGSATSSDMGWVQRAGIREILLGGLSRPGANVHAADEHTTTGDLLALARSVLLHLAADFDGM